MADERTNRRRHPRVGIPLEARWEGQSGKHAARVAEISLGGCYVESIGQVTKGERITFQVQTPRGRWLLLHGEIVYHDENMGFGVRFLPLAPPTERRLAEIIEAAGGVR
ncbi:MAG: PilZ domain-containing protein [Acidobacteria bacterium]|nr:PilZ domain-containing protein [Acidobacteriota bacterium]